MFPWTFSARDESGERQVRDKDYYVPKNWAVRGEISDVSEEYMVKGYPRGRSKKTTDHQQEDPYYHGLSARVPAFATTKQEKESINYNQASRYCKLKNNYTYKMLHHVGSNLPHEVVLLNCLAPTLRGGILGCTRRKTQ